MAFPDLHPRIDIGTPVAAKTAGLRVMESVQQQ
jgi:hypothetical protein